MVGRFRRWGGLFVAAWIWGWGLGVGSPVDAQSAAADPAGFQSHGIPTQVSQPRGIVSTVDQAGRDVVLVWLQDYRGGYSLLMIDVLTGVTQQFETPFAPDGEEPSAVLLSSRNRLYTLFNGHFVEFDPLARQFSFWQKTVDGTAMSLTEDRHGRIWAATYPNNHVVMFDPAQPALKVHGPLAREHWAQYPRSIAADAQGWIYVGVGTAASQIYALDPGSGVTKALLSNDLRVAGTAEVMQSASNSVFASNGGQRYLLSGGDIGALPAEAAPAASALVSGAQNLVARDFPSGRRLLELDLERRHLTTQDAAGQKYTVGFRYQTRGAFLTQVCATAQGRVCGGTRFPMHTFLYDPAAQHFDSRRFPRQPNVIEAAGDSLYVAGYPDGMLFEESLAEMGHYNQLLEANPSVNRPHALVVQQQGSLVVMAGTPEYGRRGGGMVFWNRAENSVVTIGHQHLIPDHSTQAMIELADGRLLGGSTTKAGTGGVDSGADSAYLFLLDPGSQGLLWKAQVVPGAQTITDLVQRADGLVYGIADSSTLFVFDPTTRQVLSTQPFGKRLGTSIFAQGTRAFVRAPHGGGESPQAAGESIYLLLHDQIASIDPRTHAIQPIARSPVEISVGGAYANGRIYFGSNSELYSWQLP
ncbi:MAG: hypothetical protein Q4A16_07630 [Lautropia sp.]|nr:hypothetical protein [Lautropia sp.]